MSRMVTHVLRLGFAILVVGWHGLPFCGFELWDDMHRLGLLLTLLLDFVSGFRLVVRCRYVWVYL